MDVGSNPTEDTFGAVHKCPAAQLPKVAQLHSCPQLPTAAQSSTFPSCPPQGKSAHPVHSPVRSKADACAQRTPLGHPRLWTSQCPKHAAKGQIQWPDRKDIRLQIQVMGVTSTSANMCNWASVPKWGGEHAGGKYCPGPSSASRFLQVHTTMHNAQEICRGGGDRCKTDRPAT